MTSPLWEWLDSQMSFDGYEIQFSARWKQRQVFIGNANVDGLTDLPANLVQPGCSVKWRTYRKLGTALRRAFSGCASHGRRRAPHLADRLTFCVPDWKQRYACFDDALLGGAIALGHPLGASGAVLMTRMIHHMRDNGIRYGLQTMCEGGGTANATLVALLP